MNLVKKVGQMTTWHLICIFGITSSLKHQSLPPPKVHPAVTLPPTQWFSQRLDHFNPTDDRQWKQRYFINDSFYEVDGPLFIMIGGEGPASAEWMVAGSWVDYAKTFNALLVLLEHRFYGESHPTQDLTVENLRYLSSEQALADLAFFVTKIKEMHNLDKAKVFAFGGSYPGSLATWIRLKYPHIIHASISSSAPLIAQIDFKEYLDVVDSSIIVKGSKECLKQINKATQYISLLLQHRVGWQTLEKMFRLCKPLNGLEKNDVSNLFELLAENIENVVQYNEDNRAFEGVKGTNITIKVVCDIMTNESIGNSLKRYAHVNSLILDTYEEECLNHTYKDMIDHLRHVAWDNATADGGRSWIYQTCTEFGFYQTSEASYQPFGRQFPLPFFIQQCSDIYGPKFTMDMLTNGVERTNMMYGGRTPQVSRVVLLNGSIDPWHYLGTTTDLNSDAPAIFINGTAHCANMYPAAPTDPPQLIDARTEVQGLIRKWLAED